jgi:hypothetical protein
MSGNYPVSKRREPTKEEAASLFIQPEIVHQAAISAGFAVTNH